MTVPISRVPSSGSLPALAIHQTCEPAPASVFAKTKGLDPKHPDLYAEYAKIHGEARQSSFARKDTWNGAGEAPCAVCAQPIKKGDPVSLIPVRG